MITKRPPQEVIDAWLADLERQGYRFKPGALEAVIEAVLAVPARASEEAALIVAMKTVEAYRLPNAPRGMVH